MGWIREGEEPQAEGQIKQRVGPGRGADQAEGRGPTAMENHQSFDGIAQVPPKSSSTAGRPR